MQFLTSIINYCHTTMGAIIGIIVLTTIWLIVSTITKECFGTDSLRYRVTRIALAGGYCCIITTFAHSLITNFLATKWLATATLIIACIALAVIGAKDVFEENAKGVMKIIIASVLFIVGIHAIYGKTWLTVTCTIVIIIFAMSALYESDSYKNTNTVCQCRQAETAQPQVTTIQRDDESYFRPFVGVVTTKDGQIRYLDD